MIFPTHYSYVFELHYILVYYKLGVVRVVHYNLYEEQIAGLLAVS